MIDNTKKLSMYLDQNALDKLKKKGTDAHFFALGDKFNFVYSDATLREIHKAGINANDSNKTADFIFILTKLKATYFQLPDISSNSDAQLYQCIDTPCDVYLRFVDKILRYDEFTQPMLKTGLAVYDGIKDYDEFGDSQINAMSDLNDFISDNFAAFKHEIENHTDEDVKSHLKPFINQGFQEIQVLASNLDDFEKDVKLMNENLKEANQDQSIVNTIREIYCINIDNLKKIEGLNALNRIFEYLDEVKPDNFPQLREAYSSIFNENERIFIRVSLIYDFLNLIGYYPDESLNKENKFLRSCLDRHHAMLGCFCDIFVTQDKRFVKKMKVIFEYFNIGTKIYDIEVLDDKTNFKAFYDLAEDII